MEEGIVAVLRQRPREKFRLPGEPVSRSRRESHGCVCVVARWACRAWQIVFRCMPERFRIGETEPGRKSAEETRGCDHKYSFFLSSNEPRTLGIASLCWQLPCLCDRFRGKGRVGEERWTWLGLKRRLEA